MRRSIVDTIFGKMHRDTLPRSRSDRDYQAARSQWQCCDVSDLCGVWSTVSVLTLRSARSQSAQPRSQCVFLGVKRAGINLQCVCDREKSDRLVCACCVGQYQNVATVWERDRDDDITLR